MSHTHGSLRAGCHNYRTKYSPGHNLSGFASQFATQSYPCANQSQNALQVIANQLETGLLRLYPSKDCGLRFPRGGGDLVDSGLLRLARYKDVLKGISAEFQVICGFSQKIPADLLSYDKIHS